MINFSDMTNDEKQAFADFTLHEINRHHEDIRRGYKELDFIKQHYGINARSVYIGQWIEIDVPEKGTIVPEGGTDGL